MKKAIARAMALASALAIVSACSRFATFKAYPGPKLPDAQVGDLYILVPEIHVVEIDGQSVDFGAAEKKRIIVRPGRHVIAVKYSTASRSWPTEYRTFSQGPVALMFEAVPGGRYWLQAEMATDTWRPYIF
jgi:hypothetical protein